MCACAFDCKHGIILKKGVYEKKNRKENVAFSNVVDVGWLRDDRE